MGASSPSLARRRPAALPANWIRPICIDPAISTLRALSTKMPSFDASNARDDRHHATTAQPGVISPLPDTSLLISAGLPLYVTSPLPLILAMRRFAALTDAPPDPSTSTSV